MWDINVMTFVFGVIENKIPRVLSFSSVLKNISLCLRISVFYPTNPHILSHKPIMLKKNTNFLLQINNYYLTLQQILDK